jgi:hypothetical protein
LEEKNSPFNLKLGQEDSTSLIYIPESLEAFGAYEEEDET